jgi:nitroreductase
MPNLLHDTFAIREDEMELYKAIENRRTIRVFKAPATEDQLKRIILAGTKAPSATNNQPWEFVIVLEQTLIDKIADLKYELTLKLAPPGAAGQAKFKHRAVAQRDSFKNASILAIFHLKGQDASTWLAAENINLAAVAEGLGSGIAFYAPEQKAIIAELLGMPDRYELTAVLKIGVPGEEGYQRENNPYNTRRPEFSWLHINKYKAG